jgi:hypothetical protein
LVEKEEIFFNEETKAFYRKRSVHYSMDDVGTTRTLISKKLNPDSCPTSYPN